jgi:hypothetical protein
MSAATLPLSVWVVCPDYGYDGYGEPEAVFSSKEAADAWVSAKRDRNSSPFDIFELPLRRSPDSEAQNG